MGPSYVMNISWLLVYYWQDSCKWFKVDNKVWLCQSGHDVYLRANSSCKSSCVANVPSIVIFALHHRKYHTTFRLPHLLFTQSAFSLTLLLVCQWHFCRIFILVLSNNMFICIESKIMSPTLGDKMALHKQSFATINCCILLWPDATALMKWQRGYSHS